MRELIRLLAAVVLLALAGPALAVPVARPVAASAALQDQVAVEKARADKAERDLAIQTAVRESEDRQNDRAFSGVESMIGGFGVLITVIVIFFALRTEGAAAAAATAAAREELTETKAKIDDLKRQAEAATITAEAAAAKASEAVAKAEAAATAAAGEHDRAKKATAGVTEAQHEALAMLEAMRSSGTVQGNLTKEQTDTLRTAVEESAGVPEKNWTVEQFKTAIGKAMYVDRNWPEALRLASAMAAANSKDRNILTYSLNRKGDAEREQERHQDALRSYDEAILAAGDEVTGDLERDLLWAKHCRAVVLNSLGRPEEAETEISTVIPMSERIFGANHFDTLVGRHVLARSMLDQGRHAEAESNFLGLLKIYEIKYGRDHPKSISVRHEIARSKLEQGLASEAAIEYASLLQLREKAEGPGSSGAYTSRYNLALATLEAGDFRAAAEILLPIPDIIPNKDWTSDRSAKLAWVRGRVADAIGESRRADKWLEQAQALYTTIYPAGYEERRKFEAYLADRNSRPAL